MSASLLPATEGFFLETDDRRRFCLFHAVAGNVRCRGAILYVPPFGEEMNKSRRMVALQAKALAEQGFAVLLMDLFGCGDSEGECQDASWDQWKNDLGFAFSWLRQRCDVPVSLLGLRLGALLALDFMRDEIHPVHQLVLWQPVLHGQQFLTQFFRLRLASDLLTKNSAQTGATQDIRQSLNTGDIVEIAGYEITSKLTAPIDALKATDFLPQNIAVHWCEIQRERTATLPLARQKTIDFWRQHQLALHMHQIEGPEFWATQEISVCPTLIELTTKLLGAAPA